MWYNYIGEICMFKKIRNIKINYVQYGKGEDVVLLHGWGQNIDMMKPLGDNLSDHYRITIIDLPGFGLSNEPETSYSVYDYVDFLVELFKEFSKILDKFSICLNIKLPINLI